MHRAAGGSFEGKYVRDLRRTTVHDASTTAWGLNEKVDSRPGFNSNGKHHGIDSTVRGYTNFVVGKEQISLGD